MPILIWIIFEVLIFIAIAKWLGIWVAILLVVIPMIIGGIMLRSVGMNNPQNMQKMQMKMMSGGNPMLSMMKMMGLMMGGVLLLIPGFITTFLAILLLLPFTRMSVATWLMKRRSLQSAFASKMQGNPFQAAGFGQAANQKPKKADKPDSKAKSKGRTIDADEWKKED